MKVSKNIFYLLICLAFVYIAIVLWRKYGGGEAATSAVTEGFSQTTAYSLKRDDDIYDDFYSEIYNDIYSTPARVGFEVQSIIETTQPSKRYSMILDIGCGTGAVISEFKKRGYKAVGIEKSQSMYKQSCSACGGGGSGSAAVIKRGDVMDPMSYEHNTFTHITCLYMTIYHIEDKYTFFRNCHGWLMPNGYLVLHLIDFNKKRLSRAPSDEQIKKPKMPRFPYESFHEAWNSPDGTVKGTPSPPAELIPPSAPDEKIPTEFRGVKYKNNLLTGNLQTDPVSGEFLMRETFQDIRSGNVRDNEITLYTDEHIGYPKFRNGAAMEEFMISPIVDIALKSGFILQGVVDMNYLGDMYSSNYLYYFEKLS